MIVGEIIPRFVAVTFVANRVGQGFSVYGRIDEETYVNPVLSLRVSLSSSINQLINKPDPRRL
jgi:hypothetical protein